MHSEMTEAQWRAWCDAQCYTEAEQLEPKLDELALQLMNLADIEQRLNRCIADAERQIGDLPQQIQLWQERREGLRQKFAELRAESDMLQAAFDFLRSQEQKSRPSYTLEFEEVKAMPWAAKEKQDEPNHPPEHDCS